MSARSGHGAWGWAIAFAIAGMGGAGWGAERLFRPAEVSFTLKGAGGKLPVILKAVREDSDFSHWRETNVGSNGVVTVWFHRRSGEEPGRVSNVLAKAVGEAVSAPEVREWSRWSGGNWAYWTVIGLGGLVGGGLGWTTGRSVTDWMRGRSAGAMERVTAPRPDPELKAEPKPKPEPPTSGHPELKPGWSPENPFTNSLGMRFVPVTTSVDRKQKVLFSIWATRVQDYAEYARETAGVDRRWEDPVIGRVEVTPDPKCPVVKVSWEDAKDFCQWLTKRDRAKGLIPANAEYRLPTDAEWSWAVGIGEAEERAGGGRSPKEKDLKIQAGTHPSAYPWGRGWPPKKGAGNYADESVKARFPDWSIIEGYDDGYATTSPVGSFAANPNGLFDLGGNVWEWVEEFFNGESGSRALRGGSWNNLGSSILLSSYRSNLAAGRRNVGIGFRVVLVGELVCWPG